MRNNDGDRDMVGAGGGEGSVPLPTVGSQQRRSKRKINNRGPGSATQWKPGVHSRDVEEFIA